MNVKLKKIFIIASCSLIICNILLIFVAVKNITNDDFVSQYGEFEHLEITYGYKRRSEEVSAHQRRKEIAAELNLALKIHDKINAKKKDGDGDTRAGRMFGTTSKKHITAGRELSTKVDTKRILFPANTSRDVVPKRFRTKDVFVKPLEKLARITTILEYLLVTNKPSANIVLRAEPASKNTVKQSTSTNQEIVDISMTSQVTTGNQLTLDNPFIPLNPVTQKRDLNAKSPVGDNLNSRHVIENNQSAYPKDVANFYAYGDLQGVICEDNTYDTYTLHWNQLFPNLPLRAGMMQSLEDDRLFNNTNRRITGFISPAKDGFYEFELSCAQFCDFILIDNFTNFESNLPITDFRERIQVTVETLKRDRRSVLRNVSPTPVFLEKSKDYLYDITSLINSNGMFKLRWRMAHSKSFMKIPPEVLSPLYQNASLHPLLPNIRYFPESNKTKMLRENLRNDFWKIGKLQNSLEIDECDSHNSRVLKAPEEDDFFTVESDLLFPIDETLTYVQSKMYGETKDFTQLFMTPEDAERVVHRYMSKLDDDFLLQRVVHIEQSTTNKTRYFVEVDVKRKNSTDLYRSSDWIHFDRNNTMCRPRGFRVKMHETIFLLTPVKNQRRWVEYFVNQLNDLVKATGEENIHLVIVDFDSTDGDVETILKGAIFKYTLIKQGGSFNKVKGLNTAVASIKDIDPIVFVFDLQLQFPMFLFDYIRKHTFRNLTAYVPIMLRCACARHPEFTELPDWWNIWTDVGFGMISLYKTDWLRIGGMNETKYGEKWGGEDWEFTQRVLTNQIEIIHHRISGYFHLFHDTRGSWDGTKLY